MTVTQSKSGMSVNTKIDIIQRTVENYGLTIRPYSGRFMFGRSGPAFVVEPHCYQQAIKILNSIKEQGVPDNHAQDSLGFDLIFYYPGIPYNG